MKYCPYCGATLMGSAVSFCAECGKEIPVRPQTETKQQEPIVDRRSSGLDEQWGETAKLLADKQPQQEQAKVKKAKPRKPKRTKPPKKDRRSMHKSAITEDDSPPVDDGYDGYYDDILPLDNSHENEGLDPELLKRIFMVAGGAALVIGIAIAFLLLL